ncbi:MAG: undecaprenyldiphospho-muramoylpentapeptide beta-N-acetylglucosaminyltransferase [Ruminococcus sp.]|jgi:UDP-N-acetylglucosamine--N-acetylmuramyl-(pentapeptide) pyrophosphoryl-undecaprenol N-acetylglucosamine transferase|nr:undecaprenyldiphospho-muramoylpentapeptide beta-N-acetylglucosaminyltransferase [Ruminococcus sp.]
MKLLFAGGGTAGHINPALAIAGYVKQKNPDAEILFVGNRGGMEQTLVPKAGFDMRFITISGFQRKLSLDALKQNALTVKRTFSSSREAKQIIKDFKPDICIGTGGYVSGPVLREAAKLGIPTIIHEQNAYPGITNKMLSKHAKKVMLAVKGAEKYLDKNCNYVVTGNPVRSEIISADRDKSRQELGLDDRPVVLSFGGSLGAQKINENLAALIARSGQDKRYQHIHGYGKYGLWFPDLVKEKGADIAECPNLDVREYIDNMATCMAAADLVISRAGAITLSEIQALGKPAILIPSPNVAENHQYHNAMALVNNGAAEIIEEKDLTEEIVIEKTDSLLQNPEKLREYTDNAKKMAITDANERIYSVIKSVLGHL